MNFRTTFCASALAIACVAGAAGAATTDLVYQGSTPWGTKNLYQTATLKVGSKTIKAQAGLMQLKDSTTGKAIETFCIDVAHFLGNPPGKYDVSSTSMFSANVTSNVTKLFTTAYAGVTTAAKAAGFQMALWEIVTETNATLSIGSGNFQVTGTTSAQNAATGYLSGLNGTATGKYDLSFLTSLSTPKGQDLIAANTAQTPAPVPLPASVLLLAGGLAGLGGVARKKRKAS